MTTSKTQQSFFYCHIARSNDNKLTNAREEQILFPRNNQIFILLFAGCVDNHIVPHDDQRSQYAKVEYGKYAKGGVYIGKGEYSEYAKDGVYVSKGKYAKYAEEAMFAKEGHNKPLTKEGDSKPLPKDGNWAGY
jgi:hypothetical protein